MQTSAHQAEIKVALLAFQKFTEKFNLYIDSKYVVNLFPAIETALLLGHSQNLNILQQLQNRIGERTEKFYVRHIWCHSNIPGPLNKGNYMADALVEDLS